MNATAAIRRGLVADRAFVRDLGRRVATTSVSPLRPVVPALVEQSYEMLVDWALGRDHAVLIAEEGGAPAGFALLLFDLPEDVTLADQAFLVYMAVEPALQRRGIGAALLTAAEALARDRGRPHLSLMVTEENAAARALYERHGFVTERRQMTRAI